MKTVESALDEIIQKRNEILNAFIKTFIATNVRPEDTVETVAAVFKSFALAHQVDGLTEKWWLVPIPETELSK